MLKDCSQLTKGDLFTFIALLIKSKTLFFVTALYSFILNWRAYYVRTI
ncbi:hypothetical protein NT05HA_2028 [Aggregatibacter aphrophilus NJ8700]|nr:hypothetical protein NT05HA_2028 [Aggregatibacter aphrophilus NJ8700]